MKLRDESAGTLNWLAGLLLLPGLAIMSPTGRIFFIVLAAIVALIPVVFSSGKRRIVGAVILLVCLVIVAPTYLEHRKLSDLHSQVPTK